MQRRHPLRRYSRLAAAVVLLALAGCCCRGTTQAEIDNANRKATMLAPTSVTVSPVAAPSAMTPDQGLARLMASNGT